MAVTFLALRRHVTPFALALGVVILGFEVNLLAESRMALPEMPSVFFSLLAFLVLVLGQKTRWNAFIAGVTAAIAVAMKATTLVVMPAFPVIIMISLQGGPARARVERVLAFAAGFALLVVAGRSFALASGDLKLENIALCQRPTRPLFWTDHALRYREPILRFAGPRGMQLVACRRLVLLMDMVSSRFALARDR